MPGETERVVRIKLVADTGDFEQQIADAIKRGGGKVPLSAGPAPAGAAPGSPGGGANVGLASAILHSEIQQSIGRSARLAAGAAAGFQQAAPMSGGFGNALGGVVANAMRGNLAGGVGSASVGGQNVINTLMRVLAGTAIGRIAAPAFGLAGGTGAAAGGFMALAGLGGALATAVPIVGTFAATLGVTIDVMKKLHGTILALADTIGGFSSQVVIAQANLTLANLQYRMQLAKTFGPTAAAGLAAEAEKVRFQQALVASPLGQATAAMGVGFEMGVGGFWGGLSNWVTKGNAGAPWYDPLGVTNFWQGVQQGGLDVLKGAAGIWQNQNLFNQILAPGFYTDPQTGLIAGMRKGFFPGQQFAGDKRFVGVPKGVLGRGAAGIGGPAPFRHGPMVQAGPAPFAPGLATVVVPPQEVEVPKGAPPSPYIHGFTPEQSNELLKWLHDKAKGILGSVPRSLAVKRLEALRTLLQTEGGLFSQVARTSLGLTEAQPGDVKDPMADLRALEGRINAVTAGLGQQLSTPLLSEFGGLTPQERYHREFEIERKAKAAEEAIKKRDRISALQQQLNHDRLRYALDLPRAPSFDLTQNVSFNLQMALHHEAEVHQAVSSIRDKLTTGFNTLRDETKLAIAVLDNRITTGALA